MMVDRRACGTAQKNQGRSKHQTEPPLKGCIYFICARGAHTNIFHYSLFITITPEVFLCPNFGRDVPAKRWTAA